MNWTELNALLKFEIWATWNFNSLRFPMKNLMLKVSTDLPDWCNSPQVRESVFGHPGNFWMWNRESGTLESRMPLTIGIRNPSFIEKDLESSNWNPESTAWNSVSKNVLDSLTYDDATTRESTWWQKPSLIEWYGVILLWNNKLFCWSWTRNWLYTRLTGCAED